MTDRTKKRKKKTLKMIILPTLERLVYTENILVCQPRFLHLHSPCLEMCYRLGAAQLTQSVVCKELKRSFYIPKH